MFKIRFLPALFFLFISSFFVIYKSFAALTGTVAITGTVAAACDITVTTEAGATISDLTVDATDLHVATVTENCNDTDGYTVTIAGTNSTDHTGLFEGTGLNTYTLAFSITYNGVAVSGTTITNVSAASGGDVNKDVDITYSGGSSLTADTYSETLIFTIAAK